MIGQSAGRTFTRVAATMVRNDGGNRLSRPGSLAAIGSLFGFGARALAPG